MEKQKEIEEISKKISDLIERSVEEVTYDDTKWKKYYENVIEELEYEIQSTEPIIADFTEAGLSINRIEVEGYMRALKTMLNRFKGGQPEDSNQ